MNVLWLGPYRQNLERFLLDQLDSATFTEEPLTADSTILSRCEFLVSYGYKHLVPAEVLARFPKKAVNLHISYLPWNRGADPNLWSFLDDTPKGVSIHYMTEKVDAGDLLCQETVMFSENETLRSSYTALSQAIESLFLRSWKSIKEGKLSAKPQPSGGSFHRKKDADLHRHRLNVEWDTPVRELIGKAKCHA
jgi:methionyl-tRNA formyltransferase